MNVAHDFLVGLSKSFGLFYLIAFSVAVLIYTYWPTNKQRFDRAAKSILDDEDTPWAQN
jgi:cytochrome c oxidase cbb3-type subunit 4